MKRTITILTTTALLLSTLLIGGCGKDDAKVSVDETTEVQTTEEVTTEEATTAVVEVTTAEPETVFYEAVDEKSQDDPKYQAGMQKIYAFIEAYDELMAHDKNDVYKMMISAFLFNYSNTAREQYNFIESYFKDNGIVTKDGKNIDLTDLNIGVTYINSIIQTYFYNYVNNDTGYYDIFEWAKNQESWESINDFMEAGDGLFYLDQPMKASLFYGQFLSSNKNNINGAIIIYFENPGFDIPDICEITPIYYIGFEINDTQFWALFDENDNLLDINLFDHLNQDTENLEEVFPYIIDPLNGISYYDIYTGKSHID